MTADWVTDVIDAVERWIASTGEGDEPAEPPAGSMRPRFRLDELLAGLRAAGPAPLAEALAQRRLAGPPTSAADAPELLGAQVDACRACLSPGVRLVWRPPGTDTTHVRARAVEELVRRDERVLLVSTEDVAVDDVLRAVVRRMHPEPGGAIRVGAAHRAENAGEPVVALERLVAQASRTTDERRAAVAAELQAIEEIDARIEELRAELCDHDEPAYRAAATRLGAARVLEESRQRLPEAEAVADTTRKAALAAAGELQEAFTAAAALGRLRDALEHERSAAAALAVLEQRLQELRAARDALVEQTPSSGWAARRRHRHAVDAADVELRRFTAVAADGRRRWLDVQLSARAILGEHSQADVDRADRRVTDAEEALTTADHDYRLARDALADLRSTVDEAQAADPPSEQDRRLVADADAQDLPARHARLQELLDRQRLNAQLRGPLELKHRALGEQAQAQRTNAEAEIVRDARVVATTLSGSRAHPAIARETFDVVLVDEAGAALLPEVLLALCRATTTAVVFGDVGQPGPVFENPIPDEPGPVQRWVGSTCFSHVGIESPADAERHDGCVALTRQFRSGPGLHGPVQDAVHELLRRAEADPGLVWHPEAELVSIDACTVPRFAEVRPGAVEGSRRTAGAVLARVLAGWQLPDGPARAAMPSRVLSEAMLAAVRDSDLIAGIGIARDRDRLYLVGRGATARTAHTGALGIRRDLDRGAVGMWSAATPPGTAEPAPVPVDAGLREVRARLRQPEALLDGGTGVDREPVIVVVGQAFADGLLDELHVRRRNRSNLLVRIR